MPPIPRQIGMGGDMGEELRPSTA